MTAGPSFIDHHWPETPAEARDRQRHLAGRVIRDDTHSDIRTVAGVDVAFPRRDTARAAVVVLSFPELAPLASAAIEVPVRFPYVPGLLSFRELPAVQAALATLDELPDLLVCDGQGYAHPRRFGLACHVGVVTGCPAIGAAKSRLIGTHDEPGPARGDWSSLMDKDEAIGAVLRTRAGVRPLYVSVGHRVSLATAIRLTLACAPRYRLPEPTRLADRLSKGGEPFP